MKVNEFFVSYASVNYDARNKRQSALEVFKEREEDLKLYREAVSELDREQNRVNLSVFPSIKNRMMQDLFLYQPGHIEEEVKKVKAKTARIEQVESEMIRVAENLVSLNNRWASFLERNPRFNESYFKDHFIGILNGLMDKVNEISNPNLLIGLEQSIGQVAEELDKFINQVEIIKEYVTLNIFIGEDAEKLEKELIDLQLNNNNLSVTEFFDTATNVIAKANKLKFRSKKGRIPIPVVKVYNAGIKNVYKYTLRFANTIVLYENFFNEAIKEGISHSDNWEERYQKDTYNETIDNDEAELNGSYLKIEETRQFAYIDNFPVSGIFDGRKVVENLQVSSSYITAVQELSSFSFGSFILLFMFLFLSTIITSFMGGTAIFVNMIIALISGLGFGFWIKFLKASQSTKRKLPNFFTFAKINFLVAREGDNFVVEDALRGVIQDFDNTILNKDFHKSLEKNKKFIVY